MRLALQMYESPDGALLADWSDAERVTADTGPHGFRSCSFFAPMTIMESFRFYDMAPGKWLSLNYGAGVVWEGRVEDRAIVTGGLRLTALGSWRAMYDAPYTALWSKSGTAGWRALTTDDRGSSRPEKYEIDNNNRIFIALKKNEAYTTSTIGRIGVQLPDDSSRNLAAITFDLEVSLPSSHVARIVGVSGGFGGSATVLFSATGTGALVTYSSMFLASGYDAIWFDIAPNSSTTYTGETGDKYLKATNIRLVTSSANWINTTLTADITSTGSQTATVGSTERMYVGQQLVIQSGTASTSERVTVTAVNSSTQFTAVFANTHSSGETVRGLIIYADEIIKDLVSHISGINSGQLSSSTALIESPGLDLLDESYEDAWPGDIATKLATLGDNQSPPRQWEVGVWEDQVLHFRPRGDAGREWAVDAEELEVDSTLETLINSAYAVYQDANNRTLRTATADDDASQDRYGITRRAAVTAQTTSATQAGVHRDARLEDGASIRPRASILLDYLTDGPGAIYPKWLARSGDTLTLRNLPPSVSEEIDRIRTFTVAETTYDVDMDDVQPVPELPPSSLEVMLARREEGINEN